MTPAIERNENPAACERHEYVRGPDRLSGCLRSLGDLLCRLPADHPDHRPAQDPDTPSAAGDERCPSCEHSWSHHSEPGCWFTVVAGRPGKDNVCACSLLPVDGSCGRCRLGDTILACSCSERCGSNICLRARPEPAPGGTPTVADTDGQTNECRRCNHPAHAGRRCGEKWLARPLVRVHCTCGGATEFHPFVPGEQAWDSVEEVRWGPPLCAHDRCHQREDHPLHTPPAQMHESSEQRSEQPAGPDGCPTCSQPSRETVGLVCQTCGTDYGALADGDDDPWLCSTCGHMQAQPGACRRCTAGPDVDWEIRYHVAAEAAARVADELRDRDAEIRELRAKVERLREEHVMVAGMHSRAIDERMALVRKFEQQRDDARARLGEIRALCNEDTRLRVEGIGPMVEKVKIRAILDREPADG